MGIEAAGFISELVGTNPTGADDYATADDHLRLIKDVLKAQFPNFTAAAVTPSVAELNFVDGVTSAIQTQLNGKAASAHAHTSSEISALDVSDITTGIFAAGFIPNLDASKITSGIFAAARIPTHTGNVTGQTALTIAADAVTYAKMQNVSVTDRLLGRDTAGAGDVEEISPTAVRAMLGVEAGATADQSNAEIKTAYEANANTNAFTDVLLGKLNGVETSATADQSAGEIEGIVNHDNLLGFAANEHNNWAADLGGTNLHANNSANGVLALTSAEVSQLANIGVTSISAADWTAVAALAPASETVAGVVERATQVEVDAGTDTTRYASVSTLFNASFRINTVTGTTDVLAAADMNRYMEYTNVAAIAVTLNSGVGKKGNWIVIEQAGAGQVTVSGTATLNNANGLKTAKQRALIVLYCTATNVWTVGGDATT